MDVCENKFNNQRDFEMENKKNMKIMSEEEFRRLNLYDPPPRKKFLHRIKESVKCNKNFVSSIFPIVKWLPSYKKSDLASDVIAGFTVGVMHIPQGMAYALLGGVPPIVGIYMAFFPVLVYVFMGTSPHVSMGTFAVVCMMVGKSVDEYAHQPGQSNSTLSMNDDPAALTPVEVATALCFLVGIWQVILSLLRLGALSVLLSPTLVSGFTTGAAVHVLTSQIRNLLGIKVHRYSGYFKIIFSYRDIFNNLPYLNVAETVLSAVFITVFFIFNTFIKPLLRKKLKTSVPFPIELLLVITGTLLSMYLDAKNNFGVGILESVPKGLPKPTVPPLHLLPELVTESLIIAVVAVSINISLANLFAQKSGLHPVNGNQELLASGVGNIFSSFFSCMPFAASLSRSLVQVTVGCKTQVTSVVSSFFLLFILLFVGPYFEPLPYCVLSSIIVVALSGMFTQIKDVPGIFRKSKLDGFVWVITFFCVVILDISYGLGIGLLCSVFSLILQSGKFEIATLGQIPNTTTYADVKLYKKAKLINNVIILRVVGSLHFVNSDSARKRLLKEFTKFCDGEPPFSKNEERAKYSKCMVLDLSCVPFADPLAIKNIKNVYEDLKVRQCDLLVSGCHPSVYAALEKSDLFKNFPKNSVFHDLDDAVQHARQLIIEIKGNDEIIMKF